MIAGAKQMPSNGKEIANGTVDRQEPLGLSYRLEAPHLRLAKARG
jgi:hypothetical protein